jgi:hypothetical protein
VDHHCDDESRAHGKSRGLFQAVDNEQFAEVATVAVHVVIAIGGERQVAAEDDAVGAVLCPPTKN